MEKRVSSIAATVRFTDGTECAILLTPEGIQRWGADRQTLGAAVDITEAMHAAIVALGAFQPVYEEA